MGKLTCAIVAFAVILFAVAVFIFMPISQFPEIKGEYGVGQRFFHWVDKDRKELDTKDLEHPYREIVAYVFYPAKKDKYSKRIPYDLDAAKSTMENLGRVSNLPSWLFGGIRFIKTHAQWNAPLAKNKDSYPVIIFSHGGGPMIQHYTWLLENLASHGFVVVAINHPYVASVVRFPDNRVVKSIMTRARKIFKDRKSYEKWKFRQIETNAQDVTFAINKMEKLVASGDSFWSRVDLKKVGKLGQSFGGAVTMRATRKDRRIKCGVNMDERLAPEDIDKPFDTPFLFLLAGKSHQWFNPKKLEEVFRLARMNGTNIYTVMFKNLNHGIFSDSPLHYNTTLFTRLLSMFIDPRLGVPVKESVAYIVDIIPQYLIDFFNKHLKNKQSNFFPKQKGEIVFEKDVNEAQAF